MQIFASGNNCSWNNRQCIEFERSNSERNAFHDNNIFSRDEWLRFIYTHYSIAPMCIYGKFKIQMAQVISRLLFSLYQVCFNDLLFWNALHSFWINFRFASGKSIENFHPKKQWCPQSTAFRIKCTGNILMNCLQNIAF